MFKRLKIKRVKNPAGNWFDEALGQIASGIVRLISLGRFTLSWGKVSLYKRLNMRLENETKQG